MTKNIGFITGDKFDRLRVDVTVFEKARLDPQAFFAAALIERWGMVAGMPDGEDSAGRMKLRLASPEELVERAFTTAAMVYARAEADGLVLALPDVAELMAQAKAKEAPDAQT